MKKKELYVCEICGAEYENEYEAIDCEELEHSKIESIDYEYAKNGHVPDRVKLKLTGKREGVAVYKFLNWRKVE